MNINEYDFSLPENLITQNPSAKRDECRLLVLNKENGELEHQKFTNIINYLDPGDVLVLNETKVMPGRIIGNKTDTKAKIELLLLKNIENNIWECLAKPVKRLEINTIVEFGNNLKARVIKIKDDGIVHVDLIYQGSLYEILDSVGVMPLPPYIKGKLKNNDDYQTVYAKNIGSAAAPTAGLHFTEDLLHKIEKKGIKICKITLHVGLGTFRPIQTENIKNHKMHSEYYEVSEESAKILTDARDNGNKIYAVGTTCVRTLETVFKEHNKFKATSGDTEIFIYPGFEFKVIDGLITNFHLPKSTLIMLVSAFAGKENIMNAYQEAIENKYRFFSFGDAMLISPKGGDSNE